MNNKNNKKAILLASILLIPGLFNFSLPTVQAQSIEGIQGKIQALLSQISQLQTRLTQTQMPPLSWCHTFNVNLKYGDSGSEVEALHIVLGKEGLGVKDIEENGQGRHFFGEITASMVSGFQQKYAEEILKPLGLKYGTGYVGKATRAKLNQLYGCEVIQPPKEIPSVTVLSPNGGEAWTQGEKQEITWRTRNANANGNTNVKKKGLVDIYLDSWVPPCPKKERCPLLYLPVRSYLLAGQTENDGSFTWLVGKDVSGNSISEGSYQIRIADVFTGANDASDSYFKIVSKIVTENRPPELGPIGVPSSVSVGEPVTFYFTATDSDNDNLSWSVDWGDLPGPALACQVPPPSPNRQNWEYKATHAWNTAGTYQVTVTVNDCRGGQDQESFTINVIPNGVNQPPVISGVGGPTALKVNETGTWTVKAYDPDGTYLYYSVDWGDIYLQTFPADRKKPQAMKQEATFTHSYSQPGNYKVIFTVSDDKGASAQTSLTVSVGVTTSQTDLEVRNIQKGDFHPYGFHTEVCMYGSKSINDLKKEIPGLLNWPAAYVIYDSQGKKYQGDAGAGGSIEEIKNGQCTTYGWTIQSPEQSIYDQTKTVNYVLDPNNLIAELNENNNIASLSEKIIPSITVLSPNGGEKLEVGKTYTINWKASGLTWVIINLLNMSNGVQYGVTSEVSALTSSYSWTVPSNVESGTNYKIHVGYESTGDFSDAPFSIVSATTTCTSGSKIVQRQALGGSEFQNLKLDTSAHLEILRYRLKWFGGPWSYWFTPGVNDVDWKTNLDGTSRRVWAYFDDHTHEIEVAESCDTKGEGSNPLEY